MIIGVSSVFTGVQPLFIRVPSDFTRVSIFVAFIYDHQNLVLPGELIQV